MPTLTERLKSGWDRIATAYKARLARSGLVVLGVLVVVETLLYAVGNDVAVAIAKAVWWFIKQPMGVGGLVFLAFNCFLVGHAYLETVLEARQSARLTGKGEQKPALLPPLPDSERFAIEHVRAFWRGEAAKGARKELQVLAIVVRYDLQQQVSLAYLVKYPIGAFEEAWTKVDEVLTDASTVPLLQIGAPLEQFFARYMYAVKWVHEFSEINAEVFISGAHQERYARWRARHEEMAAEFKRLALMANLGSLSSLHDEYLTPENWRFRDRPEGDPIAGKRFS